MAFKIIELTGSVPQMASPRTCGPTVTEDPTSVVCTWVTDDATGFQNGRKMSQERLTLLRIELRQALAVH